MKTQEQSSGPQNWVLSILKSYPGFWFLSVMVRLTDHEMIELKRQFYSYFPRRGVGVGVHHTMQGHRTEQIKRESARGAVGKPLLWVFGFVLWAGTGEAGQVG